MSIEEKQNRKRILDAKYICILQKDFSTTTAMYMVPQVTLADFAHIEICYSRLKSKTYFLIGLKTF